MKNFTIAFIGAGNLATCMINGLIHASFDPKHIWASCPTTVHLENLKQRYRINVSTNNLEAAKQADVIVLAVKPQIIKAVMLELSPLLQTRKVLVISVAAAINIAVLEACLGSTTPIIRCMPNVAASIGYSASTLCANQAVTAQQKQLTETIISTIGSINWINNDNLMDSITALSGSGPAYFFLVMEALQEAAIRLGLPADLAKSLTLKTALGSAQIALKSNEDLVSLRKRVTSKGGVTEAALTIFEENQFRQIFLQALDAARKRSLELSEIIANQ